MFSTWLYPAHPRTLMYFGSHQFVASMSMCRSRDAAAPAWATLSQADYISNHSQSRPRAARASRPPLPAVSRVATAPVGPPTGIGTIRKRERRVRAAIVSLHTRTHEADAAGIAASRAPEKAASISAILRRKSWYRSYNRIIGPGILPGRGAAAQAAGPGRPGTLEFLRPSLHASRRPRTSGPPPPGRASPPPSDREVES